MARLARCTLADLAVYGQTRTLRLTAGQVVDLDQEVSPGMTLAEALGRHLAAFVSLEAPAERRRTATRIDELFEGRIPEAPAPDTSREDPAPRARRGNARKE